MGNEKSKKKDGAKAKMKGECKIDILTSMRNLIASTNSLTTEKRGSGGTIQVHFADSDITFSIFAFFSSFSIFSRFHSNFRRFHLLRTTVLK